MNEWISVKDRLPVNSSRDEWESPFHEEEVEVLINGSNESKAVFWCCWSECVYDNDVCEFITEFDVENVTHWRRIKPCKN